MADETTTLWQLEADPESVLAAFDEIDAGAQSIAESVSQAVAGMDEAFSAFGEELASLNTDVSDLFEMIGELQAQLDGMAMSSSASTDAIAALNEQIAGLEAEISTLTTQETAAAESTAEMGAAASAAAGEATTLGDALHSAMGPLMMIGTIVGLVGGKFIQMGLAGQKGGALLSGMAGASQQDIQALEQESLKLGVSMTEASSGFYEVESAGYSGAQAITVFDSAMKLALGGQAQAKDVMTGLTAIMHDYGLSASDATSVTDKMDKTVKVGKQMMQDFTQSVGPLAAAGHKAGMGLNEMLAAETTMTQINPRVRQDSMQLAAMFDSLDPKMGKVQATAKKLKLSFDEHAYASMNLLQKLQYLAEISGGVTTPAFAKLTGGVRGATAASDIMMGNAQTFKNNLAAIAHSAGSTEQAFSTWENTIPAHLDKVGAALSNMATKLMDAIGPKVIPIIDQVTKGIGQLTDLILNHTSQIMPILAGIAAIIGGALVAALVGLVTAIWPFLALGAAVAGVVYAFQHWGDIMGRVHAIMQNPVIHTVLKALQDMWGFLVSNFAPVWHQLVQLWQTQLMPLFKQLWGAIQPLIPVFEIFAGIIGGLLAISLGILFGVLAGLAKAFAGFLSGIIIVIGGVIRLFTGLVQIFSGLVSFFVDLFTGHFDRLGADLGMIWQGIINIFLGAWEIIKGIFLTAWYTISGYITGFVQGIIGYFQHLFDALVGHSIIPDLINEIGRWFSSLPGKALQWGADLINGFITGIQNTVGALGNTVHNVASTVAKFLHFSKPDEGPLADFDTYAPDMIAEFVRGLEAGQGQLKQAMSTMAGGIATSIRPNISLSPGVTGGFSSLSGGTSNAILLQILTALQQQQRGGLSATLPPSIAQTNNITLSGISNIQALYNAFNAMAGLAQENMSRGSY